VKFGNDMDCNTFVNLKIYYELRNL